MNNNEDFNINNTIKSNYKVPDIIDTKIDAAFQKISAKKPIKKITKLNIFSHVAAVIMFTFLSGNAVAFAMHQNNIYTYIYDYFTPAPDEQVTEILLEGFYEDSNYVGLNSNLGYSIQYDPDLLDLVRENNIDYYYSKNDEIKDLAYVTIEHIDTSYDEIKDTMKKKYSFIDIDEKEFSLTNTTGFVLVAIKGSLNHYVTYDTPRTHL